MSQSSSEIQMRVEALRAQIGELRGYASLIGAQPPRPNSVRARVGAVAVQAVRRSLFWIFPQFQAFHDKLLVFLEMQIELAEALAAEARQVEEAAAPAAMVVDIEGLRASHEHLRQGQTELWTRWLGLRADVDRLAPPARAHWQDDDRRGWAGSGLRGESAGERRQADEPGDV